MHPRPVQSACGGNGMINYKGPIINGWYHGDISMVTVSCVIWLPLHMSVKLLQAWRLIHVDASFTLRKFLAVVQRSHAIDNLIQMYGSGRGRMWML
jgi:hypothetical protein